MRRARLRPGKWRETVAGKLAKAMMCWFELRESERPEQNRFNGAAATYAARAVGWPGVFSWSRIRWSGT